MKIAFDFDGTITKNPFFFKFLIESLINNGSEIYIISGTCKKDRKKMLKEIKSYNIKIFSENIITKDKPGNLIDVTEWKKKVIDELKIRVYFENREETSKLVSELCTVFKIL